MIKAVGEFVLVKRDENPETSEGGIVLLPSDEPASGTGSVLSIGNLVNDVSVGQKIVFPRYAGTEIHAGQDCVLVLRTTDILATLEP